MKDVFKYELKRSMPFFPILLGVGIVIYFFVLLGSYFVSVSSFTGFIGYFTFASILLLIFYNFGYNKKRISLDLYYALPVTHKELFLAKYLFTLVEIVIMFIVLMLCSYVFAGLLSVGISFSGEHIYLKHTELLQIFYAILIQLISGISLMNVILLFFNRANHYIDAILYILIILFIPKILLMNIAYIIEQTQLNDLCNSALDFGLYTMLGSWCKYYVCNTSDNFYTFNTAFGLIITTGCGLSFIPLYIHAKKSFAEKVELPDTKIFGYKILIPILIVLVLIYFSLIVNYIPLNLILLGVVLLLQYGGYVLFERTIKISKINLILIVSTIILGLILMFSININ